MAKTFFLFLDKQKMTSQYSRSPGSWRHVARLPRQLVITVR